MSFVKININEWMIEEEKNHKQEPINYYTAEKEVNEHEDIYHKRHDE